MTRRFVIAADKLTPDQEKEFKDFLHEFGGYWHWIENFWLLVVEGDEDISSEKIRDKVKALNKASRVLVLEVGSDIDWAGSGKKMLRAGVSTIGFSRRGPTRSLNANLSGRLPIGIFPPRSYRSLSLHSHPPSASFRGHLNDLFIPLTVSLTP